MEPTVSRRRLLGLAGAAAGGAALTAGVAGRAGAGASTSADPPTGPADDGLVPFHGPHQAGIAVPCPAHVVTAGIDVAGGADELRLLLDRWSDAAARLCAGEQVGERSPSSRLPPVDTGEADDRPPARLTLTVGAGPSLFGEGGPDRFGLAARRPATLQPLPAFPGDQLDPTLAGGDLVLQAGADDLQVVLHAVRNLVRAARGAASVRWSHIGFGPPAVPAGAPRPVHRNLLGFRDGTANPEPGTPAFDDAVWVGGADGPAWLAGGTHLVVRRTLFDLAAWDDLNLLDRERVIGRHRRSGAPLGERDERGPLDLDAEGPDGLPVTDPRSHVALAHRATEGRPLYRRSYNLATGVPQAQHGAGPDGAGLVFCAFCRDPGRQFVPVQQRLAEADLLNRYTRTVSSEVFAVFPGLAPGGSWSTVLFDA